MISKLKEALDKNRDSKLFKSPAGLSLIKRIEALLARREKGVSK